MIHPDVQQVTKVVLRKQLPPTMDIQRLDLFQDVSRAKSGPLQREGQARPHERRDQGKRPTAKTTAATRNHVEPRAKLGRVFIALPSLYISIRDGYLLFWRAQAILTPHHFRDEVVRVQIRDIKELVESKIGR